MLGCSGGQLWGRVLRWDNCGCAAPGCLIVLVVVVCVKGASFVGVRFADRTSSTLDPHHHDQGRTQLSRSCSPEWSHARVVGPRGGGCRGHRAGTWRVLTHIRQKPSRVVRKTLRRSSIRESRRHSGPGTTGIGEPGDGWVGVPVGGRIRPHAGQHLPITVG